MKKFLSVFVLLLSTTAFARVAVHDTAGVISQTQQTALIAEGTRWPFDLHVLTGAYPSPAALDTAVHRCVTGPNVVCIGIDPVHHKTNVHVGTATGIPSSAFNSIAAAGNSYFKTGDYQGGIEAIATRARELTNTSAPLVGSTNPGERVIVQTVPVQVHVDSPTGMTTGWWLFAILMGILVFSGILVLVRVSRKAKKINDDMNDFRDEAFEMSSRNLEERDFHEKLKAKIAPETHPMIAPTKTAQVVSPVKAAPSAPVGATPAPSGGTTVVHNHISGSTGGGASTGDMLLAYELGRISNPTPVIVTPTPVVTREVVREVVPADNGGSSSNWDTKSDDNDSGGSSSSWSSSDNDSGSSSSDSGSSSWDSGGSSDSGSSGGDSGGGGSDW